MRRLTAASVATAAMLAAATAGASNVTEFPDNGSEQLGRGGAWVARASDPLAAFYNPAGLAGQPTRLTAQGSLAFRRTCFDRVKALSDGTDDGVAPGAAYPRVCADTTPFPNGQLALAHPISRRIGLGLALLGPSALPWLKWPEFVDGRPAPQRHLLLESFGVALTPSLGMGFEVVDGLRLGASLQWGSAYLRSSAAATALNQSGVPPAFNDVKATLEVSDAFVPGFTVGALWTVTRHLELAGWYRWSAPIEATGEALTEGNYFTDRVARGDTSKVARGDTSLPDCGQPGSNACADGDDVRVVIPVPMEAKIGLRWRVPRPGAPARGIRDPLSQELFDVEIDFTWANNSALDYVSIRFPSDAEGKGIVPVVGTAGAFPPNADVRHGFRDVVGVRVGGDYAVVPDHLAVRGGAFVEPGAQDQELQNLDFMGATRFGLAIGATARIHTRTRRHRGAVELMVALAHVFVADQSNDDPAGGGLHTIAGTPSHPQGSPKHRTRWPNNLGTIENTLDVINVGASYRF